MSAETEALVASQGIGRKLALPAVVLVLAIAALWGISREIRPAVSSNVSAEATQLAEESVSVVPGRADALSFQDSSVLERLQVEVGEVALAGHPEPLRLPGSLLLDPNRVVRVHSRFPGEVVSIGHPQGEPGRALRYGDVVKAGQVLAVIWSKDIGEKKSELVDALSRLTVSRALLAKLERVDRGVITERMLFDARRAVEADMIAVSRVERTLRSWRLSEDEIEAVRREVEVVQQRGEHDADHDTEKDWAETQVIAAIDGIIVEKNFNVGDMVTSYAELLKIADMSRLQVVANVYEEDLASLRAIPPDQRHWKIALKSDSGDDFIKGSFELIGKVIDPAQRTGMVIGWLDNPDGHFVAGQFITASVDLPADGGLVKVPPTAVVEEGNASLVFVETDRERCEFECRHVDVVRRGADSIIIRSRPFETDHARSAQPLQAGERVIVRGALRVNAELAELQSVAAQ